MANAIRWASANMQKSLPIVFTFLPPASNSIVWVDIKGLERGWRVCQGIAEYQADQMPNRIIWKHDEKRKFWSHWQNILFHQSSLWGKIQPASTKTIRRDWGNSIYPKFLHDIVFLFFEVGGRVGFLMFNTNSFPWFERNNDRGEFYHRLMTPADAIVTVKIRCKKMK